MTKCHVLIGLILCKSIRDWCFNYSIIFANYINKDN